MFKVEEDFNKFYFKIINLDQESVITLNLSNDNIIYSSLNIFLSEFNLSKYSKSIIIFIKKLKKMKTNWNIDSLLSVSIYLCLNKENQKNLNTEELKQNLCEYFIIHKSTLENFIKKFKKLK